MENYRQNVAWFLFDIGAKYPKKEYFSVVEESHFSGIPSNKPNLYLLISMKSNQVIRILAHIEYTSLTGKSREGDIWLSGQLVQSEKEKYGIHLPIHGFYRLGDIDSVLRDIS